MSECNVFFPLTNPGRGKKENRFNFISKNLGTIELRFDVRLMTLKTLIFSDRYILLRF